jgi:hypothetical protein
MKRIVKKSSNNNNFNDTDNGVEVVIGFISLLFLFFVMVAWGVFIHNVIIYPSLLNRNYSETQIQNENIRIIVHRDDIRASNGDILPQKEFVYHKECVKLYICPVVFICIACYFMVLLNLKRISNYITHKFCSVISGIFIR